MTPGIYCTVDLHVPQGAATVTVPADAIIFNASGVHVAVVQNGVAHLRKVSIARDLGTEVELRDGVKQGRASSSIRLSISPRAARCRSLRIRKRKSGSEAPWTVFKID